jgi:tetratricopeptide (TPR) repeat protein
MAGGRYELRRVRTTPGAPEEEDMKQGTDTLRVFDFGLLFQALAQSLKVGVLKVSSRHGEKYLHFSRGRLKAIYTKRSKIRIGRILYNMRVLELADLQRVLEDKEAGRVSLPVGEEFVVRGLVSEADLATAVNYQMTEEILEIFYWHEYSYEFFGGSMEKTLLHLSSEYTRVGGDQDVQELLLNVSRIVDEIRKFNQVTPSLRDVYELTVDPEAHLESVGRPPELVELLRLIDGSRDLREILKEIRLNRFEVLELLFRLRTGGIIRPKNSFELLMLAENQRRSLTPERLARLYERVRELGVEGFDVTERLAGVYEESGDATRAAGLFVEHSRRALEAGDPATAGRSAKRAVDLFPDSVEFRELLIRVLLGAGDRVTAVDELSALAGIFAAKEDTGNELKTLSRAHALGSGDRDLLLRIGRANLKLGRMRSAAGAFVRLGEGCARAGEADRALEHMREAVRACPENSRFRWILTVELRKAGRAAEAGEEARRLIPAAWERCERSGRRSSAVRGALRALCARLQSLELGDSAPVGVLADALARCGDVGGAKALLSEAARKAKAEGRLDECREALGRASELAPEDVGVRSVLAGVLVELGDVEAAVPELLSVARLHAARGESSEAELNLRRVLEMRPISPDVMLELAELLLGERREKDAAELFARIGNLNRAAGASARAAEFLDRACQVDPGEPTHLRALAEALGEVLDMDRSVESFERLVALLRGRGDHAAALDAGLKVLEARGPANGLDRVLRESWRALGERLDLLVSGRRTPSVELV